VTAPYAKIIEDSITPTGVRLVTAQVCFWRPVLAEWNTHRLFSRNSASSRARSLNITIREIEEFPALPMGWLAEKRGMTPGDEIDPEKAEEATQIWLDLARDAVDAARALQRLGVHKSAANRLLEPWMMHTAVVTATGWENFFAQRCHPAAQKEIRVPAEMLRDAMAASEPRLLREGEWHLPYVTDADWKVLLGRADLGKSIYPDLVKVSAARSAQVSYVPPDEVDLPLEQRIDKDLARYDGLLNPGTGSEPHWSPLEHVATPWPANRQSTPIRYEVPSKRPGIRQYQVIRTDHLPKIGNLLEWRSLRTTVEAETEAQTYR
jgi:hypothetical protein